MQADNFGNIQTPNQCQKADVAPFTHLGRSFRLSDFINHLPKPISREQALNIIIIIIIIIIIMMTINPLTNLLIKSDMHIP